MVSAATATAATATSSKRRLSDSLKRPARSRPGRLSDKLKAPLASAAIKGGGKQPQPQPQQHKQQPQMPSTPASDDMADILKLAQNAFKAQADGRKNQARDDEAYHALMEHDDKLRVECIKPFVTFKRKLEHYATTIETAFFDKEHEDLNKMYEAYSDYLQGISDSIGGLEAELKQRTFAASEVSNSIAKKLKTQRQETTRVHNGISTYADISKRDIEAVADTIAVDGLARIKRVVREVILN